MEQENEKKIRLDEKSYSKQYTVITANKKLNSSEKILLWTIISLSENRGYCFATQQTLANIIWKSESYIKKLLNKLEEKWFIRKEPQNEWMKRGNHIYVDFDRIWKDVDLSKWIELKWTPNKDDFIPKKKKDLIDSDIEVYIYYQWDELISYENFWYNRREVVNEWWTSGRDADEINIKFQKLYVGYVRGLWRKKREEWRKITEEEVDSEILRGLGYDLESTYNDEDYEEFHKNWRINILPSFWLKWEDWDSRPIRDVVLDKFRAIEKLHSKEGRREEREKRGDEIKKDWKEFFDSLESSWYRIEEYLTEDEVKKKNEYILKMREYVFKNYLIYNWYWTEREIEWFGDYHNLFMSVIGRINEFKKKEKEEKKKIKDEEKKILESKKEAIEDKKKELKEIKKVEKIEE